MKYLLPDTLQLANAELSQDMYFLISMPPLVYCGHKCLFIHLSLRNSYLRVNCKEADK